MQPHPGILTVNAGSSSIRFACFRPQPVLDRVLSGSLDRVGAPGSTLRVTGHGPADNVTQPVNATDQTAAVKVVADWLAKRLGAESIAAIGHRIVHGGPSAFSPHRVTPSLLAELKRMSPFDPEHLPTEIALIEAFTGCFSELPQIACFDTAFHHDLPRVAQLIPLPRRYQAMGLRRYGFHGLSYQFLLAELGRIAGPAAAHGRVVFAHLGNGASLAAVRDGRPIDTTMGFSPASGVAMGTRSGDLDPSLLSFLSKTEGTSIAQFQHMVNHESGLLGLSETASDMRDLLERTASDVRAAEAVDLFCYDVKKALGSFVAVLGGLDTLVFAAGIGENCPEVRARICHDLVFLGVELDPELNARNASVISAATSRVTIRVFHTDEESVIAQATLGFLDASLIAAASHVHAPAPG